MFKIEDMQTYGKDQYEQAVSCASGFQSGFSAIAAAYGDYAKKSYEDTKSFVEKLSGVKSLDKAIEAQSDFAKSTFRALLRTRRRSPVSMATSPSRLSSLSKASSRSSRRHPDRIGLPARHQKPGFRPGFFLA